VDVIRKCLAWNELPEDAIQFIDSPDRAMILELLKLHEYVDVIIPRGSARLHAFCRENSQIPVITGGMGICHLFVDESARLDESLPVIYNAKTQRPSTCNSLDTVLVHKNIAAEFLPRVVKYLDGVSFRVDPRAAIHLSSFDPSLVSLAGPEDFDTEWLSLVLGLKVVDGLDEAIQHIAVHSTAHSDGILTENHENALRFINDVDSAAVYVNASTRFTDGSQFGLGAEVACARADGSHRTDHL
jgi:glutamate-5-semialdehyde dehydrogenase